MLLQKEKEKVLEKINARKNEIRKELGEKIGKQVRIVPQLVFFIDEVEENAQRLDEIIKNLNIPPETKDDNQAEKILIIESLFLHRAALSSVKTEEELH